ncbi:hypothetical protein [Desulfurivibrio alkaliphilus]|uniref:Uncharacterized protein n=1 Tax=Desulfurivibrio alkaliphilus (strain DSM 19089 / UNIQEM U267 / AHT2) TaxID=589865 RepID=D6Z3X2_DESAT|nr:hypothetical protein [Desulfurivibrio alkaliphilus]ADH86247.1 hypothetical protein DaAHT2_1552 [Desulfurivibrio alkaliphilus AHT 2]
MEFFASIIDLIDSTGVPDQISNVEVAALFTNPWFMVPFVLFVVYKLYRQALNTLVLTGLAVALWVFSGSPMMDGLIIDGELQLNKVLPVAGVGLLAVVIAVYFLFIRSD